MSAYTARRLELIPAGDGLYTASAPVAWEIGRKGSDFVIVVPASFPSDGPSIPAIFTPIFSRTDPRYQKAARIHDYLLKRGWTVWTSTAVFYDALKADRVPGWQRWAMTLGVLGWQAVKQR